MADRDAKKGWRRHPLVEAVLRRADGTLSVVASALKTVRFWGAGVVLDALAAGGAYLVEGSASMLEGLLLVVGAILIGPVAAFVSVLVWAWFTMPRRELEYRIDELESILEEQRGQILALTPGQPGESDQIVSTYHDLRTDLGDAARKIERALDTNSMWGITESLSTRNWKRHKNQLAHHPRATADNVYGACAEAFAHMDRLNGVLRFGGRAPKASDDLRAAAAAIATADQRLLAGIGDAKPDQPS